MRREYLLQNVGILGRIWSFSTLIALCILLIRNSADPGMIVLSMAIGLVFTCLTCEKLNSLSKIKDVRFMLHSIFWTGFVGFGIVTLLALSFYGMLACLILQGFFNALVVGTLIFYHSAVRAQYQKTLE